MGLIARILDLALIVVPVLVEWFKRRREEEESAAAYVRRIQEERRRTYDALLKEKGDELSALAWTRIRTARFLLDRVRKVREPKPG